MHAEVSTEDELASIVEQVRHEPGRRDELTALLRESAPVYDDRGSAATARLRGWVLASFAEVGLPPAALPHVLGELESGLEPYLVAAAARAVRGAQAPTPVIADALVAALVNIRGCDDSVTFDALRPSWPAAHTTTASLEVLASLRWLGAVAAPVRPHLEAVRDQHGAGWSHAVRDALDETIAALGVVPAGHCCSADGATMDDEPRGRHVGDVGGVELEDQDGRRLAFADFFSGRPALAAFFYTRCPNPNRCSLTITKLAEVQRLVEARADAPSLGIAAITYDPGYDLPARLRGYGESRGLHYGESVRLLRAPSQHGQLRRHFDLQVGYNGSIVNRHAVELFLVGADGGVAHSWSRTQWDPHLVLARALEG